MSGEAIIDTGETRISTENLLGFLIHEYPNYIDEVPIMVLDATRPSPKGAAHRYAERPPTLTLVVPDDVVVNMTGKEEMRDWYVMMRVSREALDKLQDMQESRIIQPGKG